MIFAATAGGAFTANFFNRTWSEQNQMVYDPDVFARILFVQLILRVRSESGRTRIHRQSGCIAALAPLG